MNEAMLYQLSAAEGFAPRIGRYVSMLADIRERTLRYVEGLTPAQLSWYPNSRCESIATLLLHIAGVERSWIGEDILKIPMREEEWKYAFPIRLGIEQISAMSLEYYKQVLQKTRTETLAALKDLSDSDLNTIISPLEAEGGDTSRTYTIEWVLYHIAEHEAHHKGQIAVMKRLLPAHI